MAANTQGQSSLDGELLDQLVAPEHRGSEADIQATVRDLLLHGGLDLDDAEVRLESTGPGHRRVDVEVGSTVIEVKKDLSRGVEAAREQLARYVSDRQHQHGDRYLGVLTDGLRWRAYRLPEPDRLVEVSTFDLDRREPEGDDLLVWLEGLLATRQEIAPTPQEVGPRLGAGSSATKLDLTELEWLYEQCANDPGVQVKRELWARLLTTAFGTSFDADDTRLFLEHTYLVVLAKLVAHAAMGFDLTAHRVEADELLSGRLFADRQILGVVEADFFDWPADTQEGRAWVERLARRIARFRWDEVEHDVLKVLYESVIGRDTRHALGEYYTPDWLAKAMVDETIDEPVTQRVLDPGCGSGTFLFWAVRRCIEACEAAGMSASEALESVTTRVFGIDVHPVAVALARVTYVLAIGTNRLRGPRPSLTIPVWLGDSVGYQRGDTLEDVDTLAVRTGDGATLFEQVLRFPDRVVDDISGFGSLVTEMSRRAADRSAGDPVPNLHAVYDRHAVHPDDRPVLDQTMRTLCDLVDEGRDHIWGYYVRNDARPRWLARPDNRVDRLVGNPPWLSYRYMTAEMQRRFRELSQERGLWQGANVATHQDLSALFVVRTVEQYLTYHGRFAFLMPLAVLTRQAYTGFRTGHWADHDTVAGTITTASFDPPWELHDITPRIFPVPPAMVHGSRTAERAQPMHGKAVQWSGHQPSSLDLHETLTREDVPLVTMPERNDEWSPYKDRFYQGATIVPRSLALVEPDDPGPLGTPSGSMVVRAQRSPREKHPWKSLPTLTGIVEERFVYGLHLGPTIYPFRALDPELAVLPWTGERLLAADDPELDRWPGMGDWWREANRRWTQHRAKSAEHHDLAQWFDYHNKLSAQADAIQDLRVIYTASGQYFAAALVDHARTFIEHALYWCRVRHLREGRYLTAILNAPALKSRVEPLQARGEHNPRHLDKYVWALPIPRYDEHNDLHNHLVDLATQAETVASNVDVYGTRFEAGRRRVREALAEAGVAQQLDDAVDALLLQSL